MRFQPSYNQSFTDPYSFQGQEHDDEVAGNGNSYSAEFWQYDSRLGRRWNIDPVFKEHESPYACFANNPIWFADPTGADSAVTTGSTTWKWFTESGDTYNSISKRTGVAVEDLRCFNSDINSDNQIPTGKLINISDPNCPAPATLAPITTSIGTITIGIYDPYTHPNGTDRHLNCGVIFYPNKDQTAQFYWYQTIGTNDPSEGNSGASDRDLASGLEYKNDNTAGMRASKSLADAFLGVPKGNTAYLPYSNNQVWYPGEGIGHYDKPWRNATSSGKVEWSAILCLYSKNGSTYTRIATLQYGFSISQSGVLEPAIFRANPNFGKNSSDTQGKADMQNHIKMFSTGLGLSK
jgi:RHS repeat-associated protein